LFNFAMACSCDSVAGVLVDGTLVAVKLVDFLQIVKCAKGNKRNVLGEIAGAGAGEDVP
jgi:hypothetical protein